CSLPDGGAAGGLPESACARFRSATVNRPSITRAAAVISAGLAILVRGPGRRYAASVLRMRLLGPFSVELDGARLQAPSSRRAWCLLAWLALHPGLHPRGGLA